MAMTGETAPGQADRRAPPDRAAKNYRTGALCAIATAFLLAVQQPFSALAARKLSSLQFIGVTQAALLLATPLLVLHGASRRDFWILLSDKAHYPKFAALFVIGLAGLVLYNLGLSNAHPIIIAAVLDLSPFWAAMVALAITRTPIPVSAPIFFGALTAAFIGAMVITLSQTAPDRQLALKDLASRLAESTWLYAVPIPILYALSGTLVGRWFKTCDPTAVIAVNFVTSAAALVPAALVLDRIWPGAPASEEGTSAVLLLLVGTLASAAAGRVLYQIALSATDNDNGYVTMFFLLTPGLTSLVSIPLAWWIPELKFFANPTFFFGLALVAAALLVFSIKAWR
jgi:drug/metabolite transporter (DMT)-like permease